MSRPHQGPDLAGQTFGRYTVIERAHLDKSRERHWLCRCECGTITSSPSTSCLKSGQAKSCGCLHKEIVADQMRIRARTHGLSKHPIHKLWFKIKERCYNPNCQSYPIYGGRGIAMCQEWLDNFQTFYDWATNNGYKRGLQIDRFPDQSGNYEPGNCRFVTSKENNRNRRDNVYLDYQGKRYSLPEFIELFGAVKADCARLRIRRGWNPLQACLEPNRR